MDVPVLKIYGDIGETDPMAELMDIVEDKISAKSVSDFLDEHKDARELIVKINSRGGDVQEGWTIHDLLANSGKKIKTIGEGKVYSIATIIFLVGDEREIMQNADGLIHNPFIPPYTLADQYESGDLVKIAESLKQEEEKILDFYVTRTGSPKEKLAEYMKDDTKLSAEDMLNLGFATKIIEPVKAYAYIKLKNNFKMNETDVKTFGQKIDTILEKIKNLSRVTPADQTLKDKDGKEFKLEKETGSPAVGDAASPDGSFTMGDGKIIVISNGKISEIKEPEPVESELDKAVKKIAELQNQLDEALKVKAEADVVKTEAETAKKEFEEEKAKAVAMVTELSNLKNSWKPDTRTKFSAGDKVGDVSMNRVRELRDKLNNAKPE